VDLKIDTYKNAPVKHSIVMLTYNQESLIRKALDSILSQDVLPYEILIGDDASTDNTYKIIEEFKVLYPTIVKPFRQDSNLGVFPHLNFIMGKINGDVVSLLAGDDAYKPGLLYELNKMVIDNKVDLADDFVLVTNASSIDTLGNEVVFDNFKFQHKDPFKQRLRYSLSYRSVGISASLIRKAGPILVDVGYHADWLWSLKIDHLSNKHFYTSFVSSEYYTGIGVVSQTKRNLLANSMFKVLELIKEEFFGELDKEDLSYLKLVFYHEKYQIEPSFYNYINYLRLFMFNISNLGGNNYMMNYKNLIPKQVLSKLVIIKSLIKK